MGDKKEQPREKYNKEYYIVLTVLGILLTALIIGIAIQQSKPYTIGKLISEFNKLDKKYNTSWRKEKISSINGNVISIENIAPYIDDLNKIEEKIIKQNNTEKSLLSDQKTLMIKLIQVRKEMLEAERLYQEFKKLGDKGRIDFYYVGKQININETVNCADKPFILKGVELLNQSIDHVHEARELLDFVLQNSKEARSPKLIGTDKERPEIYKGKLGDTIRPQMEINLLVANHYCKRY